MIYIEEIDYTSPDYDNCGNSTVAMLIVDSIKIPLCIDCLENLKEGLKEYESKVHCYECRHFFPSPNGFHYGGSCKLLAIEEGVEITTSNAGYDCCKDSTYYCNKGERRLRK